jgi:hypothetical protein
LAWLFKNNLDDAKKMASQLIQQEVDKRVAVLVDAKIVEVERTFKRERVIGSTNVDYYLPEGDAAPNEFKLLEVRGFQKVRFCPDEGALRRTPANVVVLDLENWLTPTGRFPTLPEADREAQAKPLIDRLLNILPTSTVLVVYIRIPVKYIFTLPKDRYVPPANNPVSLVGNVADAAYVSAGDRGGYNT